MPALLSPYRLPLLSIVSLACNRPLLRVSLRTPQPASILRSCELEFRSPSLTARLPQDLVRSSCSSRLVSISCIKLLPKRKEWMDQSEREHMVLMMRREWETLVAGVALVLIFANFNSPGWTNLFRVPTPYSPRAAASRVYSMAAPDAGSSIVVYVTVPNKETGTKLAHGIIENKLAACVNQIPGVESTYWWEGKVETDTEILLMIKTRQSLLGELTDHVKNNHPYDTPEVIALPITGGSEKYLKWIGDNTKNAEVA